MANTLDVLNAARLSFFENVPGAYLVQGTPQSVTSGLDTALTFNAAVSDNWNGWTSGSPTKYTIQVAGTYAVSASACWAGSASGERHSYLQVNGVTVIPGSGADLNSSSTNNITVVSPTVLYSFAVNDYVELYVYQSSGGALSTNAPNVDNAFISSMYLLWVHN